MNHHFSTRCPGWQYAREYTGRSEHLVHFIFTPDGETLAKDYHRYHRQSLWTEIFAFLSNFDILADYPVRLATERNGSDSSSSNGEETPDPQILESDGYYVWCCLPNPGWEEISKEVLRALETEVQAVWRLNTALSLVHTVEENLRSVPFLLGAVLAFSERHGTQAARELLEAKSMM
jgi:hypothetical protein